MVVLLNLLDRFRSHKVNIISCQSKLKTNYITNSANKENDKMKTAYKKSKSEIKLKKNLKYTES